MFIGGQTQFSVGYPDDSSAQIALPPLYQFSFLFSVTNSFCPLAPVTFALKQFGTFSDTTILQTNIPSSQGSIQIPVRKIASSEKNKELIRSEPMTCANPLDSIA